ncbi:MAG: GNAT family N-acetyltransferase [Nitrososphaerota archaeon]|jgi:RimJ/RimL family protein N-acetyltransferase|nr:GNAT family N-acetyltransferase [Nitrososphaerota archaeon]
MYDSLSENSKCFFHPGFIGFESITFNWLLAQFALAASSFNFSKQLLIRFFPFAALLTVVSTDEKGHIIGFGFVKRKSRRLSESCIGELGICVSDNNRGRGIGTHLLVTLLELAKKEQFYKIYLTVLCKNANAIYLYEKCGFKLERKMPEGDIWRGNRFDSLEWSIYL